MEELERKFWVPAPWSRSNCWDDGEWGMMVIKRHGEGFDGYDFCNWTAEISVTSELMPKPLRNKFDAIPVMWAVISWLNGQTFPVKKKNH